LGHVNVGHKNLERGGTGPTKKTYSSARGLTFEDLVESLPGEKSLKKRRAVNQGREEKP